MRLFILLAFIGLFFSCKQEAAFHFAFLSDTHIGSGNADSDLIRTIEDINKMDSIKFVVITGDITEFGSDEELTKAKELLDLLKKPWFVMPGNHDTKWSESGTNTFKITFGYDRFSYDYGGYKFIGCSSGPNMRMAPGLIPREDLIWIDSIIENSNNKPIIFLNHYPLDEGLGNYSELEAILKQGNIQGYLCGHGHRNKKYSYNGIPGAMGRSNLRAKKEYGGYNIVEINNNKITFTERTPGVSTDSAWHSFNLTESKFTSKIPTKPISITSGSVEWKIVEKSDIGAGFKIDNETLYYTNSLGYAKAADLKSGKIKWEFKTNGKVFLTPETSGEYLVFASTDSSIYCLNKSTGSLVWKVGTGKSIVSSPTIENNIVYIGGSDNSFRAINITTGEEIWTFDKVDNFIETTATIDDQNVYFGSWGTNFYALNKKTGEEQWTWNNGHSSRMYSPAACLPIVVNNNVWIVAPDRKVTALNSGNGNIVWRSNLSIGRESISISKDSLYVYVKSMQDSVYAISTGYGKANRDNPIGIYKKYNTPMDYDISPTPLDDYGNYISIPTDKGNIFIINKENGKLINELKLGFGLINKVEFIDENTILACSMDGLIARFNIK